MKAPEGIVYVVDDDPAVREVLGPPSRLGRHVGQVLRIRRGLHGAPMAGQAGLPGARHTDARCERSRPAARAAGGQSIPIIFLTAHGDIPIVVRAMKAGAVGFLEKPFREQDLLDAIHDAVARDRAAKAQRAEFAAIRARYEKLTVREREVLACLMRGRLNKQVAGDLGVSEVTVKAHRRQIMEKMGASSFAALLRMVERLP